MSTLAARVVSCCWLIFCIVWVAGAFSTRRTAVRPEWSRWWLWVVAVGALLRGSGVSGVLWSYTPAVGIAADTTTFIGLLVALWARATLGALWSSSVALKEDHGV